MYPAYIHEDDDGTASGFFPGVPGCYFAGDTVENAWQMRVWRWMLTWSSLPITEIVFRSQPPQNNTGTMKIVRVVFML